MTEDRSTDPERILRIDGAFRSGDLDALWAAVEDPAVIPNGRMPLSIGSCLVYAIYHSPTAFVRTLLEIGADPNAPVDDGFPPLIAALSCARETPGATPQTDVDEIIRLLLSFGSDPNQRGINDYTPLHMA
ncbi:MAG: ankyrin repeat domain-containing protein, partial [Myxococcota bacterium]